ncbi:MAG: hypothetical protein PVJ67_05400 [Candidatus Pacearchaeota archaeon]|jgi:hypothetical protein
MIKGLIELAWYGSYSGGQIGEILQTAEELGVFSYLLPFLLIFAVIMGILTRMKLFEDNKSVNGIIAFVVGLLALQFDFVPRFFSEVFPRFGVGLSVILIILILAGLFVDTSKNGLMLTLLGISVVVAAIVLLQSGVAAGTAVGDWFYQYWKGITGLTIFVIIIVAIAASMSGRDSEPYRPVWPWGAPPR